MTTIMVEDMPGEKRFDTNSSYFHIVVAGVDVKVKIVAIGQAGESVNVFCTQTGGKRQAWDSAVETQAQNLLEHIRQAFGAQEYKAIPLMAHNCAGLKIHRIAHTQSWSNMRTGSCPSDETLEIYNLVRQILEGLSDNPQAIDVQQGRQSRHSFHNRVAEQTLRNEITRILGGTGQTEFKINSLLRLIDRNMTH